MTFLSSETLHLRLGLVIEPFRKDRIKQGAYELSLGTDLMVSGNKKRQVLKRDDQITIPPGQFALLITEEIVTIPNDVIALISIKFTSKRLGLVNISGFHVDPGFHGRLKFSVYNAGAANIPLTVGDPLFLIWFATLDQPTQDVRSDEKNGERWMRIQPEEVRENQGQVASPEALKKELDKINFARKILIPLVVPILVFVLVQIGVYLWKVIQTSMAPPVNQIVVVNSNHADADGLVADNTAITADSVIIYSGILRQNLLQLRITDSIASKPTK